LMHFHYINKVILRLPYVDLGASEGRFEV
jgi:hypothetical protein